MGIDSECLLFAKLNEYRNEMPNLISRSFCVTIVTLNPYPAYVLVLSTCGAHGKHQWCGWHIKLYYLVR